MSRHKVEEGANLQPEKPEPMKIDEEFPWFMVIMMAVGLITLIGYIVSYSIKG